jgi:hypothetical protein
MAITSLLLDVAVARVYDAAFKVSGGSQTDLAEVTDVSANINWNSAVGKGEGAIFAISTKAESIDITCGTMTINTTSLALLTGATAPALTGATPNFVQTTNFKVTDTAPYFAFGIKAVDITGITTPTATEAIPADCHFVFPKCKIRKVTNLLPEVEGFATVKLEFTAVRSTDTLMTIVQNQTTAALALA